MTKEQQHGGETILEVSHLKVGFDTEAGEVQAVRDVSFSLKEGEVLAIVGESGCGKSVLCKSIMKMLPSNARIKEGSIFANGVDITGYKEREMAKLRGKFFSMVFQDPMTTLNPTMTIGEQIAEAIRLKNPRITKKELEDLTEANDYDKIFSDYFNTFIVSQCNKVDDVVDGVPNRHGVSHSWYHSYPSKKASLNAILLTDFIIGLEPLEGIRASA